MPRTTCGLYLLRECTLLGRVEHRRKTNCDLTGQQVVGAPKWVVNPDISVNHSVGAGLNRYALAGYAWRSSFFGTSDNSEYALVKAYGLVNLRLGCARSRIRKSGTCRCGRTMRSINAIWWEA